MTIILRRALERGFIDRVSFKSRLSFSFGDYYNPNFMGFGALYALNENSFAPGFGFDAPRRVDMEVLTYVLQGRHRHRDSLGSDRVSGPRALLRLRAGTGVDHREDNASSAEPLEAMRIYILPEARGLTPSFAGEDFSRFSNQGRLLLMGSRDGRDGSLAIARDVDLYASSLSAGASITHPLGTDREAWVQVLSGAVLVNGTRLAAGDGAGIRGLDLLRLEGGSQDAPAELLLLDMAND